MKSVALCFILAVLLLLFAPAIGRAGLPLAPWPDAAPHPTIHLDCRSQRTVVAIRIELAGHITKEYLIDCKPT